MIASDVLSALYLALEETPEDRVALLALADCYEECDDPLAAGAIRWTVQQGMRPFRYSRNSQMVVFRDFWLEGWYWWANTDPCFGRDWGHPRYCRLPRPIWDRLHNPFDYQPAVFKEYATLRIAYEALIDIWELVHHLPATSRERTG